MFRRHIIFISTLLFCCATAAGQVLEQVSGQETLTDQLDQKQDSIGTSIARGGFNAMNYSMQKRNRAKGQPFAANRFSDNSYIIAGTGLRILYPRANYHYSIGKSITLGYGKWFNAYNSVKLTLNGSRFNRKEDNAQFTTGEFYASHMFNFISYLGGYDPQRAFEMSTVEGIGYNLSILDGKAAHVFGAHIGLNLEFAFSNHLDFYIEPLATFYTDGIDHSGHLNWHKYDLGFSASIGLQYKFDSNRKIRILIEKDAAAKEGRSHADGIFITIMTGGQFQNSSIVHEDLGVLNSIGQHTALSVGKWFGRAFAMRGTAFFSNDKWNAYNEIIYPARYMGLRAEAMLDLIGLFTRKKDRWFSLPVIAGPEIGYMNKQDYADNNLNRYYLGITAGMQVRFTIAKHLEMFLEPKFSMVPYSIASDTYIDDTKKSTDYFDGLVSLSFGLGYKF